MTMNQRIEDARRSVWSYVKHYIYGCFARSWNGAIASVYAFLGLATGNAIDPENFSAPNFHTMIYVFAVAFGINILQYFRDHPIPEKIESTNPPFQPPPP